MLVGRSGWRTNRGGASGGGRQGEERAATGERVVLGEQGGGVEGGMSVRSRPIPSLSTDVFLLVSG